MTIERSDIFSSEKNAIKLFFFGQLLSRSSRLFKPKQVAYTDFSASRPIGNSNKLLY